MINFTKYFMQSDRIFCTWKFISLHHMHMYGREKVEVVQYIYESYNKDKLSQIFTTILGSEKWKMKKWVYVGKC